MSEELIAVKTFGYVWEAHIAQAALEGTGIETFLANEHVFTTAPFAADSAGVKLQVRREDADRARQILNDLRAPTSNAESSSRTEEH